MTTQQIMAQSNKAHKQKNSDEAVARVNKVDSIHHQTKGNLINNETVKSLQQETKSDKPIRVNIVGYNENVNWQPIIANVISGCAVTVSLWLAIVTYRLYKIASGQFDSVKKAGDAAENSSIIAQKTFELNKQYYKESNAPYLEVKIDSVKIYDDVGMVFVYYTLFNLTQTPVKIISKIRSHPAIHSQAPPPTDENAMVAIPNVNYYVIKESPIEEYAYGHNRYSADIIEHLRKGRQKLYMDQAIEYQNLISGEKRKYEFRVQITLTTDEVPFTNFLFNENYDIA